MAKESQKLFTIPMHKACGSDDLRPVFTNVYFHDGYMVATDAHIILRAKVERFSFFAEGADLKKLDGKYLSKKNFERCMKIKFGRLHDEGIEDMIEGIVYKFKENVGNFPNYQAIFGNLKPEATEYAYLNPSLAKRFFEIVGSIRVHMKLTFNGSKRGIKVTSESSEYSEDDFCAIIMPIITTNTTFQNP